MPKKTRKPHDFLIPNDIAALFGYAPTLKTEDDETYWKCMERVIKCVEPEDIIEWCWVYTPLLCSNARRLDLRVQYLVGRGAQTSAHVIAPELNFVQNSVSA